MKLLATIFGAAAAARLSLRTEKHRPIAKVVKMLNDMKTQLETEAKDDAEVYEKLTCWCKTNREEKTKAIELATAKIAALEASLGEDAAKKKALEAKVIAVRDENRKNQAALDEATELRMKERKAFHEEEKDAISTIDACKQAIVVLSKHHPDLAQLKSAVRVLSRSTTVEKSTIEGAASLKGFLSDVGSADSFLQIPGFQSAAPQSGQIFGILKQMKENFEGNLSQAQKEEQTDRDTYAELKAAKTAELKAGATSLAQTQEELAATKERHAQAEEDRTETKEQLAIDQEFLANLEEKCAQTDADYAARTKSRNEEIDAVADTIQILDSDDTFDQMTKTVNKDVDSTGIANFLQTDARRVKREKVLSLIESIKSKDPRIALIATYAKLDAFVKVKKAIADMITELNAQQQDEVDHRDFCIKEFNQNGLDTEAETDLHNDLVAKIEQLTSNIDTLASDMDTLSKEIEEMKTQMKRASSDRGRENADFQRDVADQRVTQEILKKALARMQEKYSFLAQPGAPHMNLSGTKTDPGAGPARFAEGGINAGGGKVIALLNSVIADSKKTEKTLLMSETDAQQAYEGFMKDSNHSIESKQKAIITKTEEKAVATEDRSTASTAKDAAVKQLKALADGKANLHGSCDFVMKNFEVRQQARSEEMEALRQATAVLSGAQ
jgi:outer membrane murein-binding lipoprotein Lpp